MYFPNELGLRISQLTPGDEIILLAGEGYPATTKETTTIVWIVAGYSALCADGTSISCNCISDFILTGNHYDQFEVSEIAKDMERQAALRRFEQQKALDLLLSDDEEPDWTQGTFPTVPE